MLLHDSGHGDAVKIHEMFGQAAPVVSFEFFPPKTDGGVKALYETVAALRTCRPSFVSVTYGAGGGTRDRTLELVGRIKRDLGIEVMAHVTCVGASRDDIGAVLADLASAGIDNVLALRGDPPEGAEHFERPPNGFGHASELIAFIREQGFPFCIGAACYPEGHPECPDAAVDLTHLEEKVNAGADFLITQLFFDNEEYFAFARRARSVGIDLPIIPGLMPVTNVAQIQRFTDVCGARIPQELRRRLEIVRRDRSAVVATGVLWTTEQCTKLLAAGVAGLHFYTLNKSSATLAVHAALGL